MSPNIQYTILAFVAVAALALVIQTVGIIVVMVMAGRAVKMVRKEMEHYRSTLNPLILKSRDLVQNIAPSLQDSAEQLNAIAKTLRTQTSDIRAAADDIIGRTRHQVSRVDQMLTGIFNRLERAGDFMNGAVGKPMRQLSGLIASAKAVVETLRDPEAGHHPPQATLRYPDGEPQPTPQPMAGPRVVSGTPYRS